MKTACLSVFYPGMERFLAHYLQSVTAQTFEDFDLVVINDGSRFEKKIIQKSLKQRVFWYDYRETPQKNRIYGLRKCIEHNYDVVICSDADETMHEDRIKIVTEYLSAHSDTPAVFNNAIARKGSKSFELFYKEKINWGDILDFNVLGYGAMNLRSAGMDFFVSLENKKVQAFDWYAGFIFSLYYGSIYFLKEALNHYRFYDDNFVGPVFEVSPMRVKQALLVKQNLYENLIEFAEENGFPEARNSLNFKLKQLHNTNAYIIEKGFAAYLDRITNKLKSKKNLYWWQEGMVL